MNCPACEGNLKEHSVDGVKIDYCHNGCGGIWFDHREIKKFDEPHEAGGEILAKLTFAHQTKRDHSAQIHCPRCETIVMMKRYSCIKRAVEIDECAQCGGIWLDQGEIESLRQIWNTERERNEAAEKLYGELVASATADMAMQSKKSLESAQRFANFFKFICPSYYLPGKQKGGAF